MLKNIKGLYGHKLSASDGDLGHVTDFYFDDQSWMLRYVVVDTGSWLSGRQVLLSPHAFRTFDAEGEILLVSLTRKQIEGSPPIESHRPVSRQYEEQYHSYYGWPAYWQGLGILDVVGLPALDSPENRHHHGHNQRDDIHLRSAKAVKGYDIEATDGSIGSVGSFMVDDKTWKVGELVVETGHWYNGKEVLIPTANVERISYELSRVFVDLSKFDIERTGDSRVVEAASSGH